MSRGPYIESLIPLGVRKELAVEVANMVENTKVNSYGKAAADVVEKGDEMPCRQLNPHMKTFEEWVVDNKVFLQTFYK